MPTTWNLGKQCVESAKVSDEGLIRIYEILGMPIEMRQCHALTQSEVLNFMGWLPYRAREVFDEYRVEHP